MQTGSSKEVSLDAIKTSNFSPSVLFGDCFVGTYAIVKICGAKLIGTDKTCHSKFPYSKQEKKMFSYITYIIASLIQHIKPVTSTELQQCGVACSPLSPPQRPLCIVGGRAVPLRFIFLDYCYFYWDTQRELVGRREACGRRQLFFFSYFGRFWTLWLWCEPLFLPLSLPPLLFFGSRSIFRAAKTENPASSSTGSPSSKYEHRRASALLRNIRNIRICMGKNLSFP